MIEAEVLPPVINAPLSHLDERSTRKVAPLSPEPRGLSVLGVCCGHTSQPRVSVGAIIGAAAEAVGHPRSLTQDTRSVLMCYLSRTLSYRTTVNG